MPISKLLYRFKKYFKKTILVYSRRHPPGVLKCVIKKGNQFYYRIILTNRPTKYQTWLQIDVDYQQIEGCVVIPSQFEQDILKLLGKKPKRIVKRIIH